MRIESTKLKEVKMIYTEFIRERHDWREEHYSYLKYHALGIKTVFTTDYTTRVPFKNTLRGLYYQNIPFAQTLLVKCFRGKVLMAVVDLRVSSVQYGQGVLIELSDNNCRSLYIPKGFAQGFLTLTDDVELWYKADNLCSSEFERVLNYADPKIELPWPSVENLIISIKDSDAPFLDMLECNFL